MFFKLKVSIPEELTSLFEKYHDDIEDEKTERIIHNFERLTNKADNINENIVTDIPENESFDDFRDLLLDFIHKSNLKNAQICKRAGITKDLFHTIKTNRRYHPTFGIITLLALSLRLHTDEYENLLSTASFSLSTNTYEKIALRYCFDHQIYNVFYINKLIYTVSNSEKELKDL